MLSKMCRNSLDYRGKFEVENTVGLLDSLVSGILVGKRYFMGFFKNIDLNIS